MKRAFVLFSAVVLMFAASGVHIITLNKPAEHSETQLVTIANTIQLAKIVSSDDCCASLSFDHQTSHDHCNMACAILPNPIHTGLGWKAHITSANQENCIVGNPLDLMKRPPRVLI